MNRAPAESAQRPLLLGGAAEPLPVQVIAGAGHFSWEDAAYEYAALIASWWDEEGT